MAQSETLPEGLRHAQFMDFDVAQLRSLIFAYTKSPEDIPRSRSELLNLLEEMRNEQVNELLARLELTQAYKHAFIFRLSADASKKINAATIADWLAANREKAFGASSLFPLDYHASEYISLRFVQPVKNHVFESVSGNTYELRVKHNRHVVIVALKPALGIIEVRFDGFEQSKQTPHESKLDYSTIAADCQNIAASILGDSVDGLQLHDSVDAMLSKHSDEVARIAIKSRYKHGTISIEADEGAEGDLDSYVVDAFPGANLSNAVTPWTNKHIMLKWPPLKMATRINFVGATSDVLFLWRRGSSKTLATTDHIVKRLVENSDTWSGDARRRLEKACHNLISWGIVTPADVAQAGGVTSPVALEFLLERTADGTAEVRYRYLTKEYLADSDNAWVSSLGLLPESVTTVSGTVLDLTNPKNIEVGFKLVGDAQ